MNYAKPGLRKRKTYKLLGIIIDGKGKIIGKTVIHKEIIRRAKQIWKISRRKIWKGLDLYLAMVKGKGNFFNLHEDISKSFTKVFKNALMLPK